MWEASFDYFDYKEGVAFPLQVRKHLLHEIAVRNRKVCCFEMEATDDMLEIVRELVF